MSGGGDYASLVALAGRIHAHLRAHPRDPQSLADLQYVAGLLKGAAQTANSQDMADAVGTPNPNPGASRAAGLTQAALDLPKNALQMILHPIQTAQGINAMNPLNPETLGSMAQAVRDPELNLAGKADAIIRRTPLNLGYAPEAALMDATGATGGTPASLTEQWHRIGNVASLALLGVNKNTPGIRTALKAASRVPVVGSIFRTSKGAVPVTTRAAAAPEGLLSSGMTETAARASLAKQGFTPALIEQALAQARGPAAPQGLLSEIPGSGGQGFEVTGSRATPPAPTAPTVAEMTRPNVGPRQPGLLSSLGRGEQFPYYPRGGAAEQAIAPFPSSASPAASSLIPMQQLQMLLRLSPEEFEAAGGLFPKAIMDQLRQLRLANPGLLAATP